MKRRGGKEGMWKTGRREGREKGDDTRKKNQKQ